MIDATTVRLLTFALLTCAFVACVCWAYVRGAEQQGGGERMRQMNPHAWMLGRTVDARVYEGSDWEHMVVVAVSWKGAVCVRPLENLSTRGRWIRKELVPERVRVIDNEWEVEA